MEHEIARRLKALPVLTVFVRMNTLPSARATALGAKRK